MLLALIAQKQVQRSVRPIYKQNSQWLCWWWHSNFAKCDNRMDRKWREIQQFDWNWIILLFTLRYGSRYKWRPVVVRIEFVWQSQADRRRYFIIPKADLDREILLTRWPRECVNLNFHEYVLCTICVEYMFLFAYSLDNRFMFHFGYRSADVRHSALPVANSISPLHRDRYFVFRTMNQIRSSSRLLIYVTPNKW